MVNKTCPFCDGKKLGWSLKHSTSTYRVRSIYHSTVYCKDCHAYGRRVLCYVDYGRLPADEQREEFKQAAFEAWNTRY